MPLSALQRRAAHTDANFCLPSVMATMLAHDKSLRFMGGLMFQVPSVSRRRRLLAAIYQLLADFRARPVPILPFAANTASPPRKIGQHGRLGLS